MTQTQPNADDNGVSDKKFMTRKQFAAHVGMSYWWVCEKAKLGDFILNDEGTMIDVQASMKYFDRPRTGRESMTLGERKKMEEAAERVANRLDDSPEDEAEAKRSIQKILEEGIDGGAPDEFLSEIFVGVDWRDPAEMAIIEKRAKGFKEVAMAKKHQLDYEQARGALIDVELARQSIRDVLGAFSRILSNAPPRIAGRSAGMESADVESIAREEISEAISELRKWVSRWPNE